MTFRQMKLLWNLIPDGGLQIGFAMIFSMFFTMAPGTTVLIFTDFLRNSGQEGLALYYSSLFFTIAASIAALVINRLWKKFFSKKCFFTLAGFAGLIVFLVSNIMLSYIRNIIEWTIVHIFLGFGFGLLSTDITMAFTMYLEDERIRNKVFYPCHLVIGFSKVFFTHLVSNALLPVRGFRDTALIMGVISIFALYGIVLLAYMEFRRDNRFEILRRRSTQNVQQNIGGDQNEIRCWSKVKTFLKELTDWSLLKNWKFLTLWFGVSLACFVDNHFSAILPLIITNMGYSKSDAASSITIDGGAEIVSRIVLVAIEFKADIKPKRLFCIATIVMLLAQIGSFLIFQRVVTHAVINLLILLLTGYARSWLQILAILVVIDKVQQEKIGSAYGIYAIINCIVGSVIGYIVGHYKDSTGSYKIPQICLLIINSASIILFVIHFYHSKFQQFYSHLRNTFTVGR